MLVMADREWKMRSKRKRRVGASSFKGERTRKIREVGNESCAQHVRVGGFLGFISLFFIMLVDEISWD